MVATVVVETSRKSKKRCQIQMSHPLFPDFLWLVPSTSLSNRRPSESTHLVVETSRKNAKRIPNTECPIPFSQTSSSLDHRHLCPISLSNGAAVRVGSSLRLLGDDSARVASRLEQSGTGPLRGPMGTKYASSRRVRDRRREQ